MTTISQIDHERKGLLLVDAPEIVESQAALEQLAALLEMTDPAEVIRLIELGRQYEQVRARYNLQRSLDG